MKGSTIVSGGSVNINLHNALRKRATYRVRARTSCRRPTKYQWYLMDSLLDRFVSKRIQLNEAQVRAGGSWKWWWPELAPLGGGVGHCQPVICSSDCRSGEDQNNALKQIARLLFWASFFSGRCRDLSERAFFVPRLALIGGLQWSYGRERGRPRGLCSLVTHSSSQAGLLSSAREHDLRASVVSRGSAQSLKTAGTACFVCSFWPHGRIVVAPCVSRF